MSRTSDLAAASRLRAQVAREMAWGARRLMPVVYHIEGAPGWSVRAVGAGWVGFQGETPVTPERSGPVQASDDLAALACPPEKTARPPAASREEEPGLFG